MNYIIMDLEWNQSNTGKEPEVAKLPFEIIEIGAIKMTENLEMVGEFNELIKPRVYSEMHHITSKLIHLKMQELERGKPFEEVMKAFREWCGDDYMFVTWGPLDLTELQRNIEFFGVEPLSDGPIGFLDAQKLFSIAYEDQKSRKALEYAIDLLKIEKDIPFHRAFSDAYYTAKVLARMLVMDRTVVRYISFDTYHPPKTREDEIKIQFDNYEKFISRAFDTKEEAFSDNEVVAGKCYFCHKNLKKKVKWFTPNGKNYYSISYCDKHGYLKGKIRLRKTSDDKVYVVKTTKFVNEEEVAKIVQKRDHARELKKKNQLHMREKNAK